MKNKRRIKAWLIVIYSLIWMLYILFFVSPVIDLIPNLNHPIVMDGALLIILMLSLIDAIEFKNKAMVISSSLLMFMTTLDILSIFWGWDSQFGRYDDLINIIYHLSYGLILAVYGVGIRQMVITHQRDMHIIYTSYEKQDAVLIQYSKRSNMVHIEFSTKFMETYHLEPREVNIPLRKLTDVVHPDDYVALRQIKDCIDHDVPIETRIHVKFDTMDRYAHVEIKGIHTSEHRFVALATDIGERDVMESTLKKAKEDVEVLAQENSKIIAYSGSLITKCKSDGTIVFMSSSYRAYYDGEIDPIEGRSIFELNEKMGYMDQEWFKDVLEKRESSHQSRIISHGEERFITWKNDCMVDAEGRVEYIISEGNDITDLMKLNRKLEEQNRHDSVTGLYGQYGLYEVLKERTMKRSIVYSIHVHNLDIIRNYYGYSFGDFILKQIGQKIMAYLEKKDIIARFDGDQFVVVIMNPKVEHEQNLRLMMEDQLYEDYEISDAKFTFKKTIGCARFPEDASSVEQVISHAILANRHASNQAINRVTCYQEKMIDDLKNNIRMAYKLQLAIKNQSIDVHFQKIFQATDQSVHYLEALSRWIDDELGIIKPDVFFNIAVNANIVDLLDAYVIEKAISKFQKIKQDPLYQHSKLSLNLSPSTFLIDSFPKKIARFAKQYGILPSDLVIEISENTFVYNLITCKKIIQAYRHEGFMIAIDDFGSQYSSLSILDHIDYDIIKMDGSFINNLSSEKNRTIIEMIVKLCNQTKKHMIAERVETKYDHDLLISLGCTLHQGYYFHRPEKMI